MIELNHLHPHAAFSLGEFSKRHTDPRTPEGFLMILAVYVRVKGSRPSSGILAELRAQRRAMEDAIAAIRKNQVANSV